MTKKINIDFYRVGFHSDLGVTFESIIQRVRDVPTEDQRRNHVVKDCPIRLQRGGDSHSENVAGELIRIRMDEIPIKASLHGSVEPIELEDDEGIGEETAFLYNKRLRILLLQRNRFGVPAMALAKYFQAMGELNEPILLDTIFQPDAYRKLEGMNIIKKFYIRFAGLDRVDLFQNEGHGVSSMIDLSNRFHSPNIAISVSMGNRGGSLDIPFLNSVIRGIQNFTGYRNQPVKKIEITGKEDEDGPKDTFDLLEYKMVETADLELDMSRRLRYEDRITALTRAWHNREAELGLMFE